VAKYQASHRRSARSAVNVVLDTNVLISGIFSSGLPGRILKAWRSRKFQKAVSIQVLQEYLNVAERLTARYADIEYQGGVRVGICRLKRTRIIKLNCYFIT
jgi:predicted nucleic acid-binding protein